MDNSEKRSIEQFNTWSKDYDQKRFWPFYFSNAAVLQTVNPQESSSILDVGCGTGILLQQMAQLNKGLNLCGLDISPKMVEVTRAKLGTLAKVQQGSANNFPYADNMFDYVTCATSFHHYPNPDNSLREMFRVLKSGGKLVVLDPFTNGRPRKVICAILDTVFDEKGTKLFAKEQMYDMFNQVGFKHIVQKTYWYYKLMTIGIKTHAVQS